MTDEWVQENCPMLDEDGLPPDNCEVCRGCIEYEQERYSKIVDRADLNPER